jgi:hypothetical protein
MIVWEIYMIKHMNYLFIYLSLNDLTMYMNGDNDFEQDDKHEWSPGSRLSK